MPPGMEQLREDQLYRILLYTNVVFFAMCILADPFHVNWSVNPLRLLTPSDRVLVMMGATGTLPIDRFHRWWSLLSANYLHGSLLHLLFNMAALRQLSMLTFQGYGPARMIVIYTLSGVAGFAVSYLAGVELTIGASASLCGLMGAGMLLGRQIGGEGGRMLFRQIGSWALGVFVFGLLVPGINNWGHGGGLACGYVLAWIMDHRMERRESAVDRVSAWVCVASTLLILLYAAASTLLYRLG